MTFASAGLSTRRTVAGFQAEDKRAGRGRYAVACTEVATVFERLGDVGEKALERTLDAMPLFWSALTPNV